MSQLHKRTTARYRNCFTGYSEASISYHYQPKDIPAVSVTGRHLIATPPNRPLSSLTMAIENPFAPPQTQGQKMTMPMPPPLLHTRSGNELYDRPSTPTSNHIVSPQQTPQGSPSKNQFPPGAHDLPNVFENAMKLQPLSQPRSQPGSPTKESHDPFTDKAIRPASPTRQSNKENAPGSPTRFGYTQNAAALARDAPYRTETRRGPQTRALTAEELEKLQQPKVKRLANVTQLCKYVHPDE